jgi:hypothetical protein
MEEKMIVKPSMIPLMYGSDFRVPKFIPLVSR